MDAQPDQSRTGKSAGAEPALTRPASGSAVGLPSPNIASQGSGTFAAADLTTVETGAAGPGTIIGHYRLLQEIGEGGFGVVFEAEQREPVQRRVALKIIKLGMDTRQVIARFEQEQQALALMDHPHIARVLDAGATIAGRPYFVMELCPGEPINKYADREHLTIAERLEVFAQVCHAVQHAHQKGIIHRDLKPSNVLVSTQDGRPHAKVIDFGIAKATAARLTDKTLFTERGEFIGTPAYMSPEQADGSPDLDTRTDVYALGALLYELLTGTTPFAADELRRAGFSEIQRIIRETEPPRPSTRLAESPLNLPLVAANRRSDPRRLEALVRGELDWIVMKCLSKDRGRRYESAATLAADIGRHRSGEPVLAAPPGATYRVRKFVHRHRVSVASAAVVAVALVGGLGATLLSLRTAVLARDAETKAKLRAERAEQDALAKEAQAREEAAKSKATLDFVAGMFSAVDPVMARGHDVTVAEVLDPAAEQVEQAFAKRPEAEAAVRGMLGHAYAQVARYPQAIRELGRAWELQRTMQPVPDGDALRVLHNYGVAVLQSGDVAHGRELLQQAYDRRRAALGPTHRDTLCTRSVLALARQLDGDVAGATADVRAVLADQEQALGRSDPDTLESLCSLADMLESSGQAEQALVVARDAVQRAATAHGAGSSSGLMARSIEAEALKTLERYEEAAQSLEQVVSGKEKLYGENHPETLVSLDLLARTLGDLHQDEEAVALSRKVVERATRTLGEGHAATLTYMNNLAQALRRAGRLDEAEPIYRRVLALRREINGERHQETLIVMSNMALLLMQRGAAGDADPLLRDALDGFRQALPEGHWMIGVALLNLGRCQTALRKFGEAETTLSDAHTLLKQALGPTQARTIAARAALAELYDAWGKPEQAQAWRTSP